MKFELIISDCDGVLVDTEPIYVRVLTEMLNDIGLPFTYEENIETFAGRSDAAVRAIIEEWLGQPLRPKFLEECDARIFEMYWRELESIPGVKDLVDSLTVPVCVASNGTHEGMRTTLGITRMLPKFEGKMFSAAEVEHGKPSPDVFLYADSKMGATPENCAVIESMGEGSGFGPGLHLWPGDVGFDLTTAASDGSPLDRAAFEENRKFYERFLGLYPGDRTFIQGEYIFESVNLIKIKK